MFTGLVEGLGQVKDLIPEQSGVRLRIQVPDIFSFDDRDHSIPQLGDSVAINGCCLTIVALNDHIWEFQAGSETLSRTNLGNLKHGDPVNLERALKADARLGGHFVQGHIDGLANVLRIQPDGEWVKMWFELPPELCRLMVTKGSVTVDGISLTVVDVNQNSFSVALIPHTLEKTSLSVRRLGDAVNIETDILGKYIEKMLKPWIDRLSAL